MTHLKANTEKVWICKRCINAYNRLFDIQQAPLFKGNSFSTCSSTKSMLPAEAYRIQFGKKNSNESVTKRLSPTESLGKNWPTPPSSEQLSFSPMSENLSLADLAEAYRKPTDSLPDVIEKSATNPQDRADDIVLLEDIEETPENNEINMLDEINQTTVFDVFDGENMRDYQGVLPLNGEQYVPQRLPLKQGALIEIRR